MFAKTPNVREDTECSSRHRPQQIAAIRATTQILGKTETIRRHDCIGPMAQIRLLDKQAS